jgi:Outer membrane efflux protein
MPKIDAQGPLDPLIFQHGADKHLHLTQRQRRPWPLFLVAVVTLLLSSSCAFYQPQPLYDQPPLATYLGGLQFEAENLPTDGPTSRYQIDPTDGLDLTEVGILAVINNADLKVQRARLGVAGAQAFSAGLLPDPQISLGLDKPTSSITGLVNGWLLGSSYDIVPLITRQARIDAARKGREKVHLDLLWQEWQVIQQSRSLAVRLQLEEQRLTLLRTMLALYRERYERSAQALTEGHITLDVNGTGRYARSAANGYRDIDRCLKRA